MRYSVDPINMLYVKGYDKGYVKGFLSFATNIRNKHSQKLLDSAKNLEQIQ